MNEDQCCDEKCDGPTCPSDEKPRKPCFDFSEALELMKSGAAVGRRGWNGRHHIQIQNPDSFSKMGQRYIYITPERRRGRCDNMRCPWVASHADLLGDDWFIVSPE